MQRLPLQPCSLSTAIADKLRTRILHREWLPGADLNEGEIAMGYGVSRTPVREAMKLLAQEGLLQALPRRGMRIATLSTAQIAEAQALAQLLHAFINSTAAQPDTDSLASSMLRIAQSRLQLAKPASKYLEKNHHEKHTASP